MTIQLSAITAAQPSAETLAAEYHAIEALLDEGDRAAALARWEDQRRRYQSWFALTNLRFNQDTADAAAKAGREAADAIGPLQTGHETAVKRRLLADADRAGLEAAVTPHVVRLWEADVTTYAPAISARLEEENVLAAAYTELTSSARLEIRGETVNLSGLDPFAESLDRAVRHEAAAAEWAFFEANAAAFDDIYDRLVALRTAMARELGFENFIELGYRRMRRVDYGPADVAAYRDEIVTHVVPLLQGLLERRRIENGWDRLYAWDEPLVDPRGNPKPAGDHDALVEAGQGMFDAMHPKLGDCFRLMNEGGFLDLKTRPAKAPGGFCDAFPTVGMPVIFANFNGTHHDIDVFTHEMGHALQCYESRTLPWVDTLWPTSESAEIHSMSLEMLTYKQIGRMVGEEAAARFRRMHMEQFLTLLVRCALGDHFQHEVYANPEMTPAERHALHRALQRRYMPWRDYGDIGYAAMGGTWQTVLHYYLVPFYYIDYALACCCALQFWLRAEQDFPSALQAYLALCARGGSAPFLELVGSAGLVSPFSSGVLADAVARAARLLA